MVILYSGAGAAIETEEVMSAGRLARGLSDVY
jgi:hypothetical protein